MALRFLEHLTEMSTKNLPGGKAWPAFMADNLKPRYFTNLWASTFMASLILAFLLSYFVME
jgi:hypothetical protein